MIYFLGTIGIKVVERISSLRHKQGIWSLADQGFVSLGGFLTNILLARYLPQADYGIYLLIYGILNFLTFGVHSALIVYPISVKGAVAERTELRLLTSHSLILTMVLSLCSSIVVAGAVFAAAGKLDTAPAAFCYLFFWQIQETIRRALMSHLRHFEALWGDGLSYLGQAGIIWLFAQTGWLSIQTTFLALALTSAIAGAVQAMQLPLLIMAPKVKDLWNYAKTAWNLGKWYLLSTLANIATLQVTPWILAIFYGTKETASVQSVMNILGVSHPILFSLVNLSVPALAKANVEGGMKRVQKIAIKYGFQYGILLFPFYGVLILFPRNILELLYGKTSAYLELDTVLRVLVVSYLLLYISQIVSAIIAALEKSKLAFVAQVGSVGSGLLVGIPLTISMGALGSAFGNVLANATRLVIYFFQFRKL